MMDTTSNGDPYQLVSYQKHAKKAHTNHEEHKELTTLTETSLCIIFKKPTQNGTEINIAATIKHLFTTMKRADPLLTILALDWQASFCQNNNAFPTAEDKFKQFFLLHPQSNNPAYKNQVPIGCILKTSKSIANLKETKLDNTKLLSWLDQIKIFLEADALGYDITKVIGFLLHGSPQCTQGNVHATTTGPYHQFKTGHCSQFHGHQTLSTCHG